MGTIDGWKVSPERVGTVANGRGVVSLNVVLLYEASHRPSPCSGGVRVCNRR